MVSRPALASIAFILAAAGCKGAKTDTISLAYPEMVFSTQWVDFGGVPRGESVTRSVTVQNTGDLTLGISAIYEGAGQEDSFSVHWDASTISCPESEDTGESDEEAEEKDAHDTGGAEAPGDEIIRLGVGCRLSVNAVFFPQSVGTLFGSLIVETTAEELEDGAAREVEYFADLDQTRAIVYLQGEGQRGQGQALVTPRFLDFGHVWTGLEESGFLTIQNVGDGDLELSAPTFAETCDPAIAVSWGFEEGTVLPAGTSSLLELSFVPEDQYAAFCTITLPTNDPDNPEITVNVQGNSGSDPENVAPTVEIRSPEPGYQHLSADPLQMELNIFDVNQPATSLVCRIRSTQLQLQTIATCTAPDESGHVFVNIDLNDSPEGADTLLVSVSDASDVVTYDSVSVLVRAAYPDSDDDGDGYGDVAGDPTVPVDCDDSNHDVYPEAAELPDGVDNDCDSLVDEGTLLGDDDGDTFSEAEGDCDDASVESYPGGPEMPDHKDNDCDGLVDESTELYDDDGDGYAEMHNDCDDSDPSVNPGAVEVCDGLDNNCNGLMDAQDGCLEVDTAPIIIGGIKMSRTACEEGDTIQLSVLLHDPDGQAPTFEWSVGDGGGTLDSTTGSSVNWTAPELPRESDGALSGVTVVVEDPDGNQVWNFDDVAVYPRGRFNGKSFIKVVVADDLGLCASAPLRRTGLWALVGLGLAALRRRRSGNS